MNLAIRKRTKAGHSAFVTGLYCIFCHPGLFLLLYSFLIKELAVNEMAEANASQKVIRKQVYSHRSSQTTGPVWRGYQSSAPCSKEKGCGLSWGSLNEATKMLQDKNLPKNRFLRKSKLEPVGVRVPWGYHTESDTLSQTQVGPSLPAGYLEILSHWQSLYS